MMGYLPTGPDHHVLSVLATVSQGLATACLMAAAVNVSLRFLLHNIQVLIFSSADMIVVTIATGYYNPEHPTKG